MSEPAAQPPPTADAAGDPNATKENRAPSAVSDKMDTTQLTPEGTNISVSPKPERKKSGKKKRDKSASPRRRKSSKSPRSKSPRREKTPKKQTETCPFADFGCSYKDERDGIKAHMRHNKTFDVHLDGLREGVIDFREDIENFHIYFERHDRLIEDLVYRIGQLDIKYNSHMVWRIDNFSYHFKDARLEKRTVIFSRPFYTGRYGYKMALSVAPYGDGDEKGQYMGVFLSLLQGDNDSLLHWPFNCPIKFTIIEQRNDQTRNDAVQTLKPNMVKKNRPFLGRPLGERNPAFGIQKFIPLQELRHRDYVRDDVMFIKVDIDTRELILH